MQSSKEPKRRKVVSRRTLGDVLASRDLLRHMTVYQAGVYEDMRGFINLPALTLCTALRNTDHQPMLRVIDAALVPWYTQYGIRRLNILIDCLPRMYDIVVVHAVVHGRLGVLSYLHKTRTLHHHAVDLAARVSQLDVLTFLSDINHTGFSPYTMDTAAIRGQLDAVIWLDIHRTEGCTTIAMDGAATNGHLSVLEWLDAHRTEGCTSRAMDGAAMHGHLAIVEWLDAHRTEGCTTDAMDAAAQKGHLHVVQWLHTHRTEGCTELALVGAATGGHLDLVEYLYANRHTESALEAAAIARRHGHDQVFAFLADHVARGYGVPVAVLTQMLDREATRT
ncbi:Aste57867_11368 [Aphanomyces stellatus]|uniref:Aste57867_11368 protein n=1 Tax=Aphanomyces stellatus TaxID=120398 RepID=A0A485KTE7_9STRA|nr:hypothetical protein As57867_011326 [Aphanomyces stellatus]VFT88230.1 Aste57867_11368 [Aphanomyces stellatus]